MKNILTTSFILIVTSLFAQVSYEKGYFINHQNEKTDCFIKNVDWKENPKAFFYKLTKNGNSNKIDISRVKEFQINGISKYKRANVKIDMSSTNVRSANLDNLSFNKELENEEKRLFLKVLVEGKASLYFFKKASVERFFYKNNDNEIKQLDYKIYKKTASKIAENSEYKKQLWKDFKCNTFKMSRFNRLKYEENELIDLFTEYNTCKNAHFTNYKRKKKKGTLFNLNLRPRVNYTSFVAKNGLSNSNIIDFGDKFNVGFGVEGEFILPFNKNKWAIIVEPTLKIFKLENSFKRDPVLPTVTTAVVNYKSIEIPFGVRHYSYINDTSKLFFNVSYDILDFNIGTTIDFSSNISNRSEEFKTDNQLVLGLGYKLKDKYSVELRYSTDEESATNGSYVTNFSMVSIIFGYTLF